ncbi:MAG: helix-turn-helix domain-containing protein [Deltaproteobacteria bacterium]|nr:helix-turn-helix domain-containing protein [Deltaproteobacteria bacterium]
MKIGEKIKNLRLAQELTQEDLANRADLTKGFISLLERDLQSPSLETLELILNALDTSLGEFFADTGPDAVVFSPERRVIIKDEEGVLKEVLIAGAQDREMDIMLVTLEPGAATRKEDAHYGDESGLVLTGKVWINLDKETFKASKGDAFYYTANKQHWLENKSKRVSKILWISAPPSF